MLNETSVEQESVALASGIYFRVVEDDFGDSGEPWLVDCLIQTCDEADFADFAEALDECLQRIQERIDSLEDSEGDEGYLDKLREKLGDTSEAIGGDWDDYEMCISQPPVRGPSESDWFTLTTVEGREAARRLLECGHQYEDCEVQAIERYERLAAVGGGGPKVKEKVFKPRPRPPITYAKVKVSPAFLGTLPPSLIRGLLTRHRDQWCDEEAGPYRPLHEAFTTRSRGPHPGAEFVVTTGFDGDRDICTFATVVPRRSLSPDLNRLMDEASEFFTWDEEALRGGQDTSSN